MKKWMLAAALALALTGCSSPNDTKETAPTTSGPPAAVTYGTAQALVDAALNAGAECPTLKTPKVQRLAADSRYCADEKDDVTGQLAFSIYASDADLQAARAEAMEFADIDASMGGPVGSVLVGPNWLIEGPLDRLQGLEPHLGGVLQNLENTVD